MRRHEHLVAARDAPGHAERAPGHVAPVVDGVGDGVVVEQFTQHAVELEAREVLAEVRVVAAAVGGDELGAVDDLVDDRRHVVLPAAGAAEVHEVDADEVFLSSSPWTCLRRSRSDEDRRRDVEGALEAQAVGDLGVDLLDAAQPQLVEHGLLDGRHRVGDVGVDEGFVSHQRSFSPFTVRARQRTTPSPTGSAKGSRTCSATGSASGSSDVVPVEHPHDHLAHSELPLDAPRLDTVPDVDEVAAHEGHAREEVDVGDAVLLGHVAAVVRVAIARSVERVAHDRLVHRQVHDHRMEPALEAERDERRGDAPRCSGSSS